MKITMLSEIDYAGSGHKLCEAISRHTNHDIKIFTGKYYNPFKHPDNSKWNRKEVQQRIEESDIVHLKGDFPPCNGYLGLKIMHKPLIVTVSGSHFRKAYHGGYQKVHPWEFSKALGTAFTPDLLYPEYSDVWTPHPIDSNNIDNEWDLSNPIILMHNPSRRDIKGTNFILDVMKRLRARLRAEIMLIEGLPYSEAKVAKKRCTIFFDQFRVGFYGNSALEAMQYGIPVVAWISPKAIKQANGLLNYCPVITTTGDTEVWGNKIESKLENLEYVSIATKTWCDVIHSYQAVAKQWDEIYTSI